MSNLEQIIELQEKYISLLGDELSEMSTLAHVHGWKSTRYEEGKFIRSEIKKLKEFQNPEWTEFQTVSNLVESIISSDIDIEEEIKSLSVQRKSLSFMSALFMNVCLNREHEVGKKGVDRALQSRKIIKNLLDNETY